MPIENPRAYLGKNVKVLDTNGNVTAGVFYCFGYDFDDEGNEFLEFDVERVDKVLIGFEENEVRNIEIVESVT